MKCPFCSKEMKKGKVKVGDAIGNIIKAGEVVSYIPEEECGKLLPKKTLNLDVIAMLAKRLLQCLVKEVTAFFSK